MTILDISFWQGSMNADKAIAAGAKAVIIRAGGALSTGANVIDAQLEKNVAKFQGRIPIGHYWYFRPQFNPIQQARVFANAIKLNDFHIPPAIDVEDNKAELSQAALSGAVRAFLDEVEYILNVVPMVYTRGIFWNEELGDTPWASRYPLWIARYNNLVDHPWNDRDYLRPNAWDDYLLWQYSASGNYKGIEFGAESKDIDINRPNGTIEEFYQKIGWVDDPEVWTHSFTFNGYKITVQIEEQ